MTHIGFILPHKFAIIELSNNKYYKNSDKNKSAGDQKNHLYGICGGIGIEYVKNDVYESTKRAEEVDEPPE